MGAASQQPQGLWIKTLDVKILKSRAKSKAKKSGKSKAKSKATADTIYTLERTTEVWCVGLLWHPSFTPPVPSDTTPAASAQAIRQFGLKVGMLFRNAHKVKSVEFAVGNSRPAPGAYKPVPRPQPDTTNMEKDCKAVFGNIGQWYGFVLDSTDFPAMGYPPEQDRLYFRVVVEVNFNHDLDCQVLPVIAVLKGADVRQHYALGVGVFSRGKSNNAVQFETAVVGTSI